jgi:hypothetical protein
VDPSCLEFSWGAGESIEHFNNVCDNVHGISVVAEIQRRISRRKFPGFLQGFETGRFAREEASPESAVYL